MGRSKQAPKIKQCASEGCTHPSECIVKVAGEACDYCRAHIPADIEVVRDKFSCEDETCPFKRTHGLPEHRGATRCLFHATEGMVQISTSFCGFPGCPKHKPVFGTLEPKHAMRCGEHRLEGMVDVCSKMCVCGEHQATHPAPDSTEKKYCGTCAQRLDLGTKNEKSKKKCIECGDFASYARQVGDRPTHCAKHGKPLGFIDVTHKKCEKCKKSQGVCTIFPDGSIHCLCVAHGGTDKTPICIYEYPDGTPCTTHASFDPDKSAKRPRYCDKHAPPGSMNIHAILCECPARSRCTFNFYGQPPRFCENCKQPGMIDVVSTRCKICGERAHYRSAQEPFEWFCIKDKPQEALRSGGHPCCIAGCPNKEAIFGFPPTDARANPKQRYCKKDKLPGMIDLVHEFCDCPQHLRATFYVEGAADGKRYCLACKPANAITENPTCPGTPDDPCDLRATYGPLYGPPVHCATHTAELDEDGCHKFCEFTNRYPKCQRNDQCPARPTFSITGDNFPTFCAAHAPADAREVVQGRCSMCGDLCLLNCQGNICVPCESGTDRKAKKTMHHTREKRMLTALTECGLVPTTHDKCFPQLAANGCRKRPDFYFDCGNCAIILEVDEHHHGGAIAFRVGDEPLILNISEDIDFVLEAAPIDPDAAECVPKPAPSPSAAGSSASHGAVVRPGQHVHRPGYTRDGELARMIEIHKALKVPTIHVRYCPDAYTDHAGVRHPDSRGSARDAIAANYVKSLIEKYTKRADDPECIDGLYVAYMFYDGQEPNIPEAFIIDLDGRVIESCDL